VRFDKRGKLNPRYVGPFKVLAMLGKVAYKLELPKELSRVHHTFHVSNLKKCYTDEPLVMPLEGIRRLFKRNVLVTTLESGSLDAFPLFSAFPTVYTHPGAFTFSPIHILQLWAVPLEMPCSSTFKTTISLRICPIVPLSIHNVSVARTSAVTGKVPYFVTLVAPLGTRAIVMKMALGAVGQIPTVRLPLAHPYMVDPGDILPFGGLLLVTMVVSE
nr:putative reverse transcriptase domain-containing protein [Tanacetum cinerariifolium]